VQPSVVYQGLPIDHFSLLGGPPYRDAILASHMQAESGTFFLHAVPWYCHVDPLSTSWCSCSTMCAVSILFEEGFAPNDMLYDMLFQGMSFVTCFLESRVKWKS
jgi:hypothetical protein